MRSRSRERWLDLAIGLVQEVDACDADLGGRGSLLALTENDERLHVGRGIVAALVPARDQQIAHVGTFGHPASHRARGPELDVIGMRGDDEHALRGWQLVVWHRCRRS